MKEKQLVNFFEKAKIVLSNSNKETEGNLGMYIDDELKIVLSPRSVAYGSAKNVGVHEFLHMTFARYLDNATKSEIAGIIEPLMELSMQIKDGSIPLLEKDLGKLNPVEVAFFVRMKELLEMPSIARLPINELFAHMGDQEDIGIIPPLAPFYSQVLSKQYISTHSADPSIRFEDILHIYCKGRVQQKQSGSEFSFELPTCKPE